LSDGGMGKGRRKIQKKDSQTKKKKRREWRWGRGPSIPSAELGRIGKKEREGGERGAGREITGGTRRAKKKTGRGEGGASTREQEKRGQGRDSDRRGQW